MQRINPFIPQHSCSILFFLFVFSFAIKAQSKTELILPASSFNKEEAYKMLEEGTNSIQGRISLKKRGYVNYPGYQDQVLLYPVTPHLLEYLELKKKYNSKRKMAAMAKEAAMARIETKTIDNRGNFEFINLKPGKYYIVSWVTWEKVRRNEVQSGPVQVAGYNMLGVAMGTSYLPTETRYDATAYEKEIGEFVEVAGSNKTATIDIAR
ncbi:hypothetical protein F3J23_11935 [Chryseobacterium sp. Tr-659]|uniref:hypothetical protein n=1 Tax=Chryseobacterium sp. Tr-659 TaxID=2608340 RepID=UPI00141ECDF6|nr:hypothetical protein [Chryseobacterium sp. Tr-659]NIF06151.1 hypothetical protein [Chryseobacterium sp. Tr-659]